MRDLERWQASILRFHERRAERILPVLFLVLAVTAALGCAWLLPVPFKQIFQSSASVALFVPNGLFSLKKDHFADLFETYPLLHMRSLAVEKQFYILFRLPLFVMFGFRRRAVFGCPLAGLIASLAFSQRASVRAPVGNVSGLPSRAWELRAGAPCALRPRLSGTRLATTLTAAGLVMIAAAAAVMFDADTLHPSVRTSLPVAGAVLVMAFGSERGLAKRLLAPASAGRHRAGQLQPRPLAVIRCSPRLTFALFMA